MTTPPSPVRLPAGVRDFLPRAAARRRAIAERLLACFEAWGYARIITPVFECADVLERGLGGDARASAIRFVEPGTGEVVALRPDFTPQVARLAATRFADAGGPLRLCYEGAVNRMSGRALGPREILQAGIELIGAEGVDADAEVIALAATALAATGLTATGLAEIQIDLGHVAFAAEVLAAVDDPAIAIGLARKDRGAIARAAAHHPPEIAARLHALVELWGPIDDVIARARAAPWTPSTAAALDELEALAARIRELAPGVQLSLDLGLARGFEYYTGVRFAGYARGAADAIVRGGRYDQLIGRYGRAAGAIGFAVDIEAIAGAQRAAQIAPPEPPPGVLVVGPDPRRAARIAAALRGRGVRAAAHLAAPPRPGFASDAGWTHVLALATDATVDTDATLWVGALATAIPAAVIATAAAGDGAGLAAILASLARSHATPHVAAQEP